MSLSHKPRMPSRRIVFLVGMIVRLYRMTGICRDSHHRLILQFQTHHHGPRCLYPHVPSHKSTASPQPCPQPCPQPRPQPCRVTNALLLHQQALDPREAPPKQGTVKSSIFNLVSTIVGGGVLSLPYAFRQTGFALGAVILGLVAIMSAYSAHLLVACGRRCNAWVTNPTAL